MSLATVTFWNESFNSYGIPNEIHSYLISVFVNEVFRNGDKVVKIISLTSDSPKPPHERPFIIKNSTKEDAIAETFDILKTMPAMKDLNSSIVNLDSSGKNLKFISNY